MIQQENLLKRLQSNLPKNLIIIAPKYYGKKTLVSEIVDYSYVYVDGKIENLRELDNTDNHVFVDIDDWPSTNYGALLKLLEDGTGHNIITCKNILNLPNAILSRCIVEYMEPYKNIGHYCDSIGQIEYYSDEMLKYIDKYEYDEKFDFDVYFTVACNRLLERLNNNEDVAIEFLITCKYNSLKNLKSINKKQLIANWKLDIKNMTFHDTKIFG